MRVDRRYYDRSTGKYKVEPYRRKRRQKARYVSKAFQAYQQYLNVKYSRNLGTLLGEFVYLDANRDGFLRKYLAPLPNAMPDRKNLNAVGLAILAKREAYEAEYRPYHRNGSYKIPVDWVPYEDSTPTFVSGRKEHDIAETWESRCNCNMRNIKAYPSVGCASCGKPSLPE